MVLLSKPDIERNEQVNFSVDKVIHYFMIKLQIDYCIINVGI